MHKIFPKINGITVTKGFVATWKMAVSVSLLGVVLLVVLAILGLKIFKERRGNDQSSGSSSSTPLNHY